MLYDFLDEPTPETERGDEPALEVTPGPDRVPRRRVSPIARANRCCDGLNFVAEPGQTTALVGRSGGGKTTAMSLILRFYEPTAGKVLIDGQDIGACSRALAAPARSPTSARRPSCSRARSATTSPSARPGASDEEIVAAAKAAYAHDFIIGFERGYDSPVGEQGMQLSGGQRQRISIARAFLKDAPLILLDEATSALDTESERAVQEALKTLCAGRTTLVIAHRLSTVANADRICVIEGGQVVGIRPPGRIAGAGTASTALLHRTQFERSLTLRHVRRRRGMKLRFIKKMC